MPQAMAICYTKILCFARIKRRPRENSYTHKVYRVSTEKYHAVPPELPASLSGVLFAVLENSRLWMSRGNGALSAM